MVNIFSSLLPYPKEDDFTSALALIVDPNRNGGPNALKQILALVRGASEQFDFGDYSVNKQRQIRAGRFDLLISSPIVLPRTQIVVENKVELSVDDRSQDSIQRYLRWLNGYRGTANFLVLNTKYSIPEGTDLANDVIVIHWHMIAKAIRNHIEVNEGEDEDNLAKDFFEFLEANDMGPLEGLDSGDGLALWDFRKTSLKFDYILDLVRSHFKNLGYKVSKDENLTFEEPYHGIRIKKGEWTDLFNYDIWFTNRQTPNGGRSFCFISQIFIEDPHFFDFLESQYSDEIAEATKKTGATLDRRFYWTIPKTMDDIKARDLDAQAKELLTFSIDSLRLYQDSLIPLLEKGARWFKR